MNHIRNKGVKEIYNGKIKYSHILNLLKQFKYNSMRLVFISFGK